MDTWYEVGLSPGNTMLDGDPAPHGKGHNTPPHFLARVYYGQTVAHLSNCFALVLNVSGVKDMDKITVRRVRLELALWVTVSHSRVYTVLVLSSHSGQLSLTVLRG